MIAGVLRRRCRSAALSALWLLFCLVAAGVPSTGSLAAPAPNTWTVAGSMSTARVAFAAVLLTTGKVLVVGGGTTSAELFDPSTGTFGPTGPLNVARSGPTATLLTNGKVLVAGGCCASNGLGLSSAELYDPASGAFSPTGQLDMPRFGHTATLLPGGRVLVAGGACEVACYTQSFFNTLRTAELYDPSSGTWSHTGLMTTYRELHTATLLPNGNVLVAGGFTGCDDQFCSDTSAVDLYDPASGTFAATGAMHVPRELHTATLLPGGNVLVAAGRNALTYGHGAGQYASAELYNPSTGVWTGTNPLPEPRVGQTATLLNDGQVLLAGGETPSALLYQPSKGIWVETGAMHQQRSDHVAALLPSGDVLVAGGYAARQQPTATAEVYHPAPGPLVTLDPTTLSFTSQPVGTVSGATTVKVTNNGSTPLLVSGVQVQGSNPSDFLAATNCTAVTPGQSCQVSVQFKPIGTSLRSATVGVVDNAPLSPQPIAVSGYGIGPGAWAPTGTLTAPREFHTAILLASGVVLVAGGQNDSSFNLASAELYSPATRTWSSTNSLSTGRAQASGTLLPTGDVLVAGGQGANFVPQSSAELYHPASGQWLPTGSMQFARYGHTATLLPTGKVLVAGGADTLVTELYDPATRQWSATGSMSVVRNFATASLLQNGTVLEAGGDSGGTAEVYTPATGLWSRTGTMNVTRRGDTATVLQTGKVLIAGGDPPACCGAPTPTAELFDPSTGTWTLTGSMSVGRFQHTASLLGNGTVLVAGGCTGPCNPNTLASSELYDPVAGAWTATGSLVDARQGQSATTLLDGEVLAAGGSGSGCCDYLNTAETYTPVK
jgi:N-acetylneuraminic acid mutarotase